MLQQLMIYLLKVSCISALLFLYYFVALRNKKFHYYNRFYLLMAVAVSIFLPFVQLEWFTFFSGSQQTIHLYNIIYGGREADMVVTGTTAPDWQEIILYFFAIIPVVGILIFTKRIIKINHLKKIYPVQKLLEFDFINTDISSAPFSFLKNIFWRNDINLAEETGKQILQHEISHIQQKHSWDKIFIQLVMCFFWMNPIFYFIKKELYLIHEFIADEHAVKHADADAFARMLLTARFGKFEFLPAQSIFYSSIKRRLTMLTVSKKPQFHYLRRLLVLPLLVSVICLFAFTVKTNYNNTNINNVISNMFGKDNQSRSQFNNSSEAPGNVNKIVPAAKPFVLVVDAGHGGKDFGASGNGLYEKSVALKIAEKIKDISQQYGIDVVLTRSTDIFMDPRQKSEFANAQNANAFISIHLDAASKTGDNKIKSGMEVYVSDDKKSLAAQSRLLGSAILQNLGNDFKTPDALSTREVGIWVLKNSIIPAALIECGFITDVNDANNLKDDSKIELMARNILQGIAVYANHSNDNLNGNSKEEAVDTMPGSTGKSEIILPSDKVYFPDDSLTISAAKIVMSGSQKALFVLDGKIISEEELKNLSPGTVASINVLKGQSAITKYGEKGMYGVVEIFSKKNNQEMESIPDNVLYVLDGKIISKDEFLSIDKNSIQSISVLKDKTATDKYGDKGKYGVVEINLKNEMKRFTPPLIIRDSDGAANPGHVDKVFTNAQKEPQFPGGDVAWQNYLARNLHTEILKQHHAQIGNYIVAVTFLIDKDGSVYDIKALNDPGYGAALEAVRVIAQGPKWVPAEQNGRKVAYRVKQNISFSIN
ncbi:MAG: N-acetylmuramoyl-L-alanine amidase [Bacteroidetes bacterium]|nr:N-acetylmuramoyl-L-alanine amidase [Bacteroidota bacterium]